MSPKHYFLISLCIQIYVKLIFSKEWCVLVVLVQTLGFFFWHSSYHFIPLQKLCAFGT